MASDSTALSIELLLEINALHGQALIRLPGFIGVAKSLAVVLLHSGPAMTDVIGIAVGAATVGEVAIKGRIRKDHGTAMLGDRDADGRTISVICIKNALRPVEIHPWPTVGHGGIRGPLLFLDRKKAIRVVVGGTDDDGLAVDTEPSIGVHPGFVNVSV